METKNSIDAIHYSEERYSSLTLIAKNNDEVQNINTAIKKITKAHTFQPKIFITENGKKTEINVEFHDDYDKEAGIIFDELMCELNIKECI